MCLKSLLGMRLWGVLAFAIMAFAPQSALGAIEVKTEPNPGSHCSGITTSAHTFQGGCGVHVVGTQHIHLLSHNATHTSEQPLAICANEFEARIDEAGEGYIYDQALSLSGESPECFIEPCKEEKTPGGAAHGLKEMWRIHIKDIGLTERLEVTLCVQVLGSELKGSLCTLHIPIVKLGHVYTINANPEVGCEGAADEREVKGRWTLESAGEAGHTSIEIVNT